MPGVVDTPMQTHLRSQEPVAFRSTVEGHFPFVLPTKKTSGGWEYIRYLEPTWPLFWLEFRPCFEGLTFKQKGHLGSRSIYWNYADILELRELKTEYIILPSSAFHDFENSNLNLPDV